MQMGVGGLLDEVELAVTPAHSVVVWFLANDFVGPNPEKTAADKPGIKRVAKFGSLLAAFSDRLDARCNPQHPQEKFRRVVIPIHAHAAQVFLGDRLNRIFPEIFGLFMSPGKEWADLHPVGDLIGSFTIMTVRNTVKEFTQICRSETGQLRCPQLNN